MSNDSTVTLRLPSDIVERLDAIAAEDEVSRSLVIRRLLLSGIYERFALDDALSGNAG